MIYWYYKWRERICTAVSAQKLSTILSPIIGMLGKRCEGGSDRDLSKWNQREITETS